MFYNKELNNKSVKAKTCSKCGQPYPAGLATKLYYKRKEKKIG